MKPSLAPAPGVLRRGAALLCLALAAAAPPPSAPPPSAPSSDRLVKQLDLGPAFGTVGDWRLAVFEADDPTGDGTARVCFTGPDASGTEKQDCTALTATVSGVDMIYNLQTITGVEVTRIPARAPGHDDPAVVVRATFSGGGSGTLTKLFVWTYQRFNGTPMNHGPGGFFMEVFSSVVTDSAEQRFFLSGPLAGCFVSADQVYLDGPTMADPQPFFFRVYRRADPGFVQVLALLSARIYPSMRGGDPPANPIELEAPRITQALSALYPHGLPR